MKIIEVEAKLEEGGIIRIPQMELDAMQIKTGDEVSLVYMESAAEGMAKEFGIVRKYSSKL